MRRISAQQRSDATVAGSVVETIFHRTTGNAKRSYLRFLAKSIGFLSSQHRDRWGATLFEWGIRLNVGFVECLVLRPGGLSVLVYKKSAPAGTKFDGASYVWAQIGRAHV